MECIVDISKSNNIIYLGFGGNLGDPLNVFKIAINELDMHSQISIDKVASIWKTGPIGFIEQPDFLNTVVSCKTTLSIDELYEFTSSIEAKLGKAKKEMNGPRVIDIDILYAPFPLCATSKKILVPHPRMFERLFVLLPLREIIDKQQLIVPQRLLSGLYSSLPEEDTSDIHRKERARKVEISDIITQLMEKHDQRATLYCSLQKKWWIH